jgi:hypothetical protein
MKKTGRLALKYLFIGIGIQIISFLAVYSQIFIIELFNLPDPIRYSQIVFQIIGYSGNIIFGVFILFDSLKFTKNKILISVVGFLMPGFGICFLLIEKYLIQKTTINE